MNYSQNIVDKILQATNNGLDIIQEIFPQATDKRNFRIRDAQDDKNPSASLYQDRDSGRWKIHDHAGDIRSEDCFGVYAIENQLSYREAIFEIGRKLQLEKGIKIFDEVREIYKYEYREYSLADCPITLNDKGYFYVVNPELSEYELSCLGGVVSEKKTDGTYDKKSIITNEVCQKVNLFSLKEYYQKKKNDDGTEKVMHFIATERFPILAFINHDAKLGEWLKIYMPKGSKKLQEDGRDRRFKYLGGKPSRYIFGLEYVHQVYMEAFEKARLEYAYKEGKNEAEVSDNDIDFKLERICIATGGSDGLNLLALGEFPIWFNSETEHIDEKLFDDLSRMAEVVVNIPDTDATGKKEGRRLALEFLQLRTLWLDDYSPKERYVKDFKDFVRCFPSFTKTKLTKRVKEILEAAKPAQFWEELVAKNGRKSYEFNPTYGFYFLRLNGFSRLEDENKEKTTFIKVDGAIVEVLKDTQTIKSFFTNYLYERQKREGVRKIPTRLINTLITSQKLSDGTLNFLHERKLQFHNFEKYAQNINFSTGSYRITADSIEEVKEHKNFVLKSKLVDELIRKNAGYNFNTKGFNLIKEVNENRIFEIKETGDGLFEIDIKVKNCNLLNYLIQTSRMYWETERKAYIGKGMKEEFFYENTRFKITSEDLTEEENQEQINHLVNKIFVIGYLFHRYKNPSNPWMPLALDNAVMGDKEAHGGSGKSIFFEMFKYFMHVKEIDGKMDFKNNRFWKEGITKHTDLIYIDDLGKGVEFNMFYTMTTGNITIDTKNSNLVDINKKESGKLAISYNYSLKDLQGSSTRRNLILAFSDYYHARSEDRKERQPKDDFGAQLYDDFDQKQWELVIRFMIECFQFYIKQNKKIEAPINNIMRRSYLTLMGEHFQEWADAYFNEKMNQELVREMVFQEFLHFVRDRKIHWLMNITPKSWMQKIHFWCKYNEFEVKSEVKRVPLVDLATLQPILENGRQKTGAKEVICIVAKEEEAQEGTPEIEFDDDF
jgi:hypothetical protein